MRSLLVIVRYLKSLLPLVVFLLQFNELFAIHDANDLSEFKPSQLKKLALRCEQKGDIYTALEYMEAYQAKENDNAKAIYYIAELYRKSRQYDSALVYYSNPLIASKKKFPLCDFYLASLKMTFGEYEEAKDLYTSFRRAYSGKDQKTFRKLARNQIIGCDSAINAREDKITAFVENIGQEVNSEHIEFSPYPLAEDLIIYGTLRLDSANVFSYSKNNAPVRKLNLAKKTERTWQSIGEADWGINHPEYNTGNAALSPDKNRLYFTRCHQNWKYQKICVIYRSVRIGDDWTPPVKLSATINMDGFSATHPAIGSNPKDGTDLLYFASNRPEGKGGFDIWYAVFDKKRGVFKKARNLGSRINSPGDEITPHYNIPTQSLYFSSNGLPGYGGFDIFRVKGWGRKWGDFENVGLPVNSSYNDMYLALFDDGNKGFFTSNRPGSQLLSNSTCCDDIYYFNWKLPKTIPAKGFVYNNSNGEMVETINRRFNADIATIPEGAALDDVVIQLYSVDEEGNENLIQSTKTHNGTFTFNLERDKDYDMVVKNYGYFEKKIHVSTNDYLFEDTMMIRKTGIAYIPPIDLDFNVYYESGQSDLSVENERLLDTTVGYLLDLLPVSVIEVGSHTDNIGEAEYNLKLSQKRSERVVEYLIHKGVAEERLIAKGYGLTEPVVPNQFPDGTDNPEGRSKNRRTHIKIIGTLLNNDDEI